MSRKPSYANSVFINCPFDSQYEPILHAVVFAVVNCGYTVRCALETEDASSTRIDKIYKLIEECRFGIHDVSRIQQDSVSGLPRFNMPFELGVFVGARQFGAGEHKRKSCLVLAEDRYTYQKFISDIAGQDIRQHKNSPKDAVGAVRDWLASSRSKRQPPLPGATAIMRRYKDFGKNYLPTFLKNAQITKDEMRFFDLALFMGEFAKKRVEQVR